MSMSHKKKTNAGALWWFIMCCVIESNCNPFCRVPPNLRLKFIELNYNFDSADSFPPDLIAEYYDNANNISPDRFPLPNCPNALPLGDLPLRDRSLCPWRYVPNHNPHRFPATILEAEPICQTCVGVDSNDYLCERLYRPLKVLLRYGDACPGGQYHYVETTEDFPVATLCAKRREVISHGGPSLKRTLHHGSNQVISM